MSTEKTKYLVMCIGYTHSGKTTFAKKLASEIPNIVQIDSDEIASFVNTTYPTIAMSEYNRGKRKLSDPNLKFLLFLDVLSFSLNAGNDIILSNGNLAKDIRTLVFRRAKKYGYKVITVFFNIDHQIIIDRLSKTEKDTKIFSRSKKWAEVFERQKEYSELPPSKKDTLFFEIKNNKEDGLVLDSIRKIFNNKMRSN